MGIGGSISNGDTTSHYIQWLLTFEHLSLR